MVPPFKTDSCDPPTTIFHSSSFSHLPASRRFSRGHLGLRSHTAEVTEALIYYVEGSSLHLHFVLLHEEEINCHVDLLRSGNSFL